MWADLDVQEVSLFVPNTNTGAVRPQCYHFLSFSHQRVINKETMSSSRVKVESAQALFSQVVPPFNVPERAAEVEAGLVALQQELSRHFSQLEGGRMCCL